MIFDNRLMSKWLKVAAKVEADEVKATALSFLLALLLMAAYYTLRPVRDAMASDWSDSDVSLLWSINFLFSFAVVAVFGWVSSTVTTRHLVPGVYGFFALTFIIFYASATFSSESLIFSSSLIDQAFYIWVSVFSLFPISVFWNLMADIFSKAQSRRLFGIITTGASTGAMLGPAIPLLFSNTGSYNLVLVASGLLILTLPIIYTLQYVTRDSAKISSREDDIASVQPLVGQLLSGFALFIRNPFLLSIGLFLFLYTGIGSFVYFEIKHLLAEHSRAQRTEIWAFMDLATNALTLVTGLFLTSRLATRLGVGYTLAIIPIIVCIGLLAVAVSPLLSIIVGLQIIRRGGNYAITRPAREMLFTHVDHDTRLKTKQVIDVVVYRGGDVFWGWTFTSLTQLVGLGVAGVALVGALIAAFWSMVALSLGRQANEHSKHSDTAEHAPINVSNTA